MSAPFNNDQKTNINNMKRSLRLELNQDKKSVNNAPVLSSPDFTMLNVDTPELEKMILQNGMTVNTPTPSGMLFPKNVTEEQESFTAGFVNALNNLHNSNSNMSNSQSVDSNSKVYADLEQNGLNFLPVVKEEPQTVPNINPSPPVSPVDMEYQERMKLERKRQRNRLAASKCRSRKLERISKLEEKVKLLKSENSELGSVVNQLKEHVGLLKVEVMSHVRAGCALRLMPNNGQYYDPWGPPQMFFFFVLFYVIIQLKSKSSNLPFCAIYRYILIMCI